MVSMLQINRLQNSWCCHVYYSHVSYKVFDVVKKSNCSSIHFFLLLGIKDSYFLHGHLVVHFEVL